MRVYGGRKCRTIIFTETKRDANALVMESAIPVECQPIHGDIAQVNRLLVLPLQTVLLLPRAVGWGLFAKPGLCACVSVWGDWGVRRRL